jgi:hypothetical protein
MTEPRGTDSRALPPAFYSAPSVLTRRSLRDWWILLHPPYTAWHLSYVVIGACLAPNVDGTRLIATVLAFFLAVGVAAHALDELHGRPLRTTIPSWALVTAAVFGLGGAAALGIAGVERVGAGLLAFITIGVVLAVGYNLELFGGRLHNDAGFAAGWGAFPVLTAYYAQRGRIDAVALAGAAFAFFLSGAQRHLSTPARSLRRKTSHVEGTVTMRDGTVGTIDVSTLLAPLEAALRALTLATIVLAGALALARFVDWS